MTLYLKFKFSKQFIPRDNVIFRRVTSPVRRLYIAILNLSHATSHKSYMHRLKTIINGGSEHE